MKRRMVLGLLIGAGAAGSLVVVPSAHASTGSSQLPPACVVASGPSGVTVQVGYAPGGPSGCHQLP